MPDCAQPYMDGVIRALLDSGIQRLISERMDSNEWWEREFGELGCLTAFARVALAEREHRWRDATVAVVECSMWLVALDNQRSADPTLRGLAWARNCGVHQLIGLSERGEGAVLPTTLPTHLWHLAWRSPDDVDFLAIPKRQRSQAANYEAALAGRPVLTTLRRAAELLGLDADSAPSDGHHAAPRGAVDA